MDEKLKGYVYTYEMQKLMVPMEEIFEKYGTGFFKAHCSPGRILARGVYLIVYEFRYGSSVTHGVIGDTQKETVDWLRKEIGDVSLDPLKFTIEKRKGLLGWIAPKVRYTNLPAPVSFEWVQLGNIYGLSGDLYEGVTEVKGKMNDIAMINEKTFAYFDEVGYSPVGFGVKSLGGSEVLNMASVHHLLSGGLKPAYWGDVLVLGDHANLKPLTAWRIISGLRHGQFIMIRDNFRQDIGFREGDYETARFIVGLTAQHGEEGSPDMSTIMKHSTEYNRVVETRSVSVDVPLRDVFVEKGLFGILFIKRGEKPLRDRRIVCQALMRGLRELTSDEPKDGYVIYMLVGPVEDSEWVEFRDGAKMFTKRPVVRAPAGGLLVKRGGRSFVRFYIIRAQTGSRSISAIDRVFGVDDGDRPATRFENLVPRDVLNDAIESSPHVKDALTMLTNLMNASSVEEVVRGGK